VWPRHVTVALSVALIGHVGFQILWFAVGGHPSTDVANWLLGLWGAAMGMQSAAVRSLHVKGVFTTAATATFIFFFGDFATWTRSAEEMRRLRGVLISLFLGATAGGLLLARAHLCPSAASYRHCHCGRNRGSVFSGTRQREQPDYVCMSVTIFKARLTSSWLICCVEIFTTEQDNRVCHRRANAIFFACVA
jgi:hypothetical protein